MILRVVDAGTADNHSDPMSVDTPAPRILVVDDEDSVRSLVERILRDGHYDVITAASGREALNVVDAQASFDVFVLDVMMPEMNGDELARQLRLREPDVKVLYFTAYADRLFNEKPVLGAYEAFLDKPVTVSGLREAVSLLLFGHTRGPDRGRS
jgi:two-component system cell cycle sensor histidine kinase/response regulator CckA